MPVLTFVTSFGPIGSATFSSTLDLAGQHFTFGPFTDLCVDPTGCGEVFGWATSELSADQRHLDRESERRDPSVRIPL